MVSSFLRAYIAPFQGLVSYVAFGRGALPPLTYFALFRAGGTFSRVFAGRRALPPAERLCPFRAFPISKLSKIKFAKRAGKIHFSPGCFALSRTGAITGYYCLPPFTSPASAAEKAGHSPEKKVFRNWINIPQASASLLLPQL